jgi:hypothetical protein
MASWSSRRNAMMVLSIKMLQIVVVRIAVDRDAVIAFSIPQNSVMTETRLMPIFAEIPVCLRLGRADFAVMALFSQVVTNNVMLAPQMPLCHPPVGQRV